jgi:tyrosinase
MPVNSLSDPTQQVLTQCAQTVAKQYTGYDSAVYQAAADKLRIPYWDWATEPRMPDIVSISNVQITTPTGVATVRNPLFSYRFKRFPLDTSQFPPSSLSVFPQTVRDPQTNTYDAVSNVARINNLLLGGQLMQRTVCMELRFTGRLLRLYFSMTP